MPKLIVNADDLGRSTGINRGILEAHQKGIVTSTSAMVNYPAAEHGIALLLEQAPFMGIGLHLTLTSGRPVCDPAEVPTLVDDDGRFYPPAALAPVAMRWAAEEVERELRAQFARFQALAGRRPDHLDSHHGATYIFPAALRVMLSLAREYNLPIRRGDYGEHALETARDWLLASLPPMQARAVAEEVHGILAQYRDIRYPDRMVSSFYDRRAILGELLTILTTLPPTGVTELMCHPGYADGLDSPYNVQREQELKWLTYPATHEVVVAEGIRLMTFAELR